MTRTQGFAVLVAITLLPICVVVALLGPWLLAVIVGLAIVLLLTPFIRNRS